MARQCLERASNQARTAARSSGATGLRSFIAAGLLESETLPVQALFQGGERARSDADAVDGGAEAEARQQAAALRDHRQVHLGAIACLQGGAQLAQPIRQPKLQTAPPGPEFAGEERRLVVLEPSGAALAHPILEAVMDLGLQSLQSLDILGLFRPKGVEHRLAFARGVHAPLHADAREQILE